jgi:hypothetical protein
MDLWIDKWKTFNGNFYNKLKEINYLNSQLKKT